MNQAIIAAMVGCAGLLVAPTAMAQQPPGTTDVEITGGRMTLEVSGWDEWRAICTTPCRRYLLNQGTYRLEGPDGVLDSKAFGFDGLTPRVHLDVRAESAVLPAFGTASLVLGGMLTGGAVFAFPIVAVADALGGGGEVVPYVVIGGALGLGTILLVTGAIVKATAPRTKVVQISPTTAVRTPEWVSPRVTAARTDLDWTFAF